MKPVLTFTGLLLLISSLSYACNVNQLDSLGLRTGYWIEYRAYPSEIEINATKQSLGEITVYDKRIIEKPICLIQKGNYVNGLKNGIWKEYWPNDSLRNIVSYINGIPLGFFKVFLPTGDVLIGNIVPMSLLNIEVRNKNNELLEKKSIKVTEIMDLIFKD